MCPQIKKCSDLDNPGVVWCSTVEYYEVPKHRSDVYLFGSSTFESYKGVGMESSEAQSAKVLKRQIWHGMKINLGWRGPTLSLPHATCFCTFDRPLLPFGTWHMSLVGGATCHSINCLTVEKRRSSYSSVQRLDILKCCKVKSLKFLKHWSPETPE
jgi:hypothetical protein